MNNQKLTYPMSLETWDQLKKQLVPGCTFTFQPGSLKRNVPAIINSNGQADFKDNIQDFDIQARGKELLYFMVDFKYPDKTPMTLLQLTQPEKVTLKIKNLWNTSKYTKNYPERAY